MGYTEHYGSGKQRRRIYGKGTIKCLHCHLRFSSQAIVNAHVVTEHQILPGASLEGLAPEGLRTEGRTKEGNYVRSVDEISGIPLS